MYLVQEVDRYLIDGNYSHVSNRSGPGCPRKRDPTGLNYRKNLGVYLLEWDEGMSGQRDRSKAPYYVQVFTALATASPLIPIAFRVHRYI